MTEAESVKQMFADLRRDIRQLAENVAEMQETLAQAQTSIDEVKAVAGPAVEALTKSPMFRMIAGKVGK